MTRSSLLTRDRPLLFGLIPAIPIGLLVWWVVHNHASRLYPPAIGGIAGGLIYLTVSLGTIPWTDAGKTEEHATRHNGSSRVLTESLLILACLLSIGGVMHLLAAARAGGHEKPIAAGVGVACIAVAWATVHTIFSLRYAHMYYRRPSTRKPASQTDPPRPIDFPDTPAYLDFFYVG